MMGYYSAIMAVIDFAGTDDSVYPPDEESPYYYFFLIKI